MYVEQVLEQVRAMVANRLGHCGMSWSKMFSLYNSGTYNNQWMVVDYKHFKKGTPQSQLRDKLLWVLEQLPGYIRAEDKTGVLRQQSYWPSYNSPYFPDIYTLSGQGELAAKYGDWSVYSNKAFIHITSYTHKYAPTPHFTKECITSLL
jgi:hypothetical protein